VSGGAPTGKWPTLPPQLEGKRPSGEAKLTVKRPGLPEVTFDLDKAEFTIGRATNEVDLTLDDDSVSRKHAVLTRDERGYFRLTDLGSKNGIHFADRTVRRLNLVDGDEFAIGKAHFVFHAEMKRFEAPPEGSLVPRPRQDSVFADVSIPRPQAEDGDFGEDAARGSGIPDPAEPR
jgi:pSer/pThr/pTyr-binding forkhead associated (FHA) protein